MMLKQTLFNAAILADVVGATVFFILAVYYAFIEGRTGQIEGDKQTAQVCAIIFAGLAIGASVGIGVATR